MNNVALGLQHEITQFFGISKKEIKKFVNIESTNYVYSFIVEKEKYVIRRLNETSIFDWKREKAAYDSLKPLNITDDLVYFDNGVKIAKFLKNSKKLGYNKPDMIEALDLIRKVHESGASIKFGYDILENIKKYKEHCDKKSKRFYELETEQNIIYKIQAKIKKLNIQPVLCHGDACSTSNFLRLPDGCVKIIDWEQAGMADPLLDIAIAALHQGLEKVDPVWCLHYYLRRKPEKREYLRLFAFLALNSYALMVWCIYECPECYEYYFNSAKKYTDLVLNYY